MPNNPIERDINNPFVMKDEISEELEQKEKPKKEIKKININDDIQPSLPFDLSSPEYLNNINEDNKIELIPNIISNYHELEPIETPIKVEKELDKNILIEKPKEFNKIKLEKDYVNKLPIHKYIKKNDKLPLLFNYYQLPDINKVKDEDISKDKKELDNNVKLRSKIDKDKEKENEGVSKENENEEITKEKENEEISKEKENEEITKEKVTNINIIENENIINNKNIIDSFEIIKPKNILELPSDILNINQINQNPEEVCEKKYKKVNIEENKNSLKEDELKDNSNKYNKLRINKISNEFLLDVEYTLNKNILIEKPIEYKENEIISDYEIKDLPKTTRSNISKLPIISNNYQLCLPEIDISKENKEKDKKEEIPKKKDSVEEEIPDDIKKKLEEPKNDNILDNEKVIDDKNKLDETTPENKIDNEISLPNTINDSIKEEPEKDKKLTSKKINVPSESDEVSYEQLVPYNSQKRDSKENIIKDEIKNEKEEDELNDKIKLEMKKMQIKIIKKN